MKRVKQLIGVLQVLVMLGYILEVGAIIWTNTVRSQDIQEISIEKEIPNAGNATVTFIFN